MSLIILTKSPRTNLFSKEIYRVVLRRIFKIKRGPDAVSASLLRGLDELKYPYSHNSRLQEMKMRDMVFVNGSIEALRWAIKEKKEGKFTKLVAGPNLVVTPDDYHGIIASPEIDLILQPSSWVRDFYLSINPKLSNKIMIWPAGVKVPEPAVDRNRKGALIFRKNLPDAGLCQGISEKMRQKDIDAEIIVYGKYRRENYYKLLEQVKFMVYLSANSESQGIALQEAWARNVPTLVWNGGRFRYKNYTWADGSMCAPYLREQAGLFFSDISDFAVKLEMFTGGVPNFLPRDYVQRNLSDRRCAEYFINLITSGF